MENSRIVSVKCPECNENGKFRVYSRFSVTDSTLRNRIKDRSIFRYECESCGARTEFDYPFHMIDKKRRQIIFLTRSEDRKKTKTALEKLHRRLGETDIDLRMTTTKNQFIEKLHLKDAGYDDRIIEFMKVYFARKLKKDFPDRTIQEILFTQDNHEVGELVFHSDEGPFAAVKVNPEIYEKFRELFNEKADENTSFEIGFHWAHSLF